MTKKMLASMMAAAMAMGTVAGIPAAAEENTDLSGTLTILSWYNETNAAPVLGGSRPNLQM